MFDLHWRIKGDEKGSTIWHHIGTLGLEWQKASNGDEKAFCAMHPG